MKWPMLMLRGSTFYSRIAVPLALQPVLKRKELWKSLRTSDPKEAQVLSLKVSAEALKLFQSLRKRQTSPSPASVAQAYVNRVRAAQDQGDEQTLSLVYSDALEAFHEAIERGDTSGINKLLDSVLMEEALHVPPARRPEFAQALLQAHLGILKERTRGVPAGPTVTDLWSAPQLN
jgi:hypothetical protein